jgi:hypothetical protein
MKWIYTHIVLFLFAVGVNAQTAQTKLSQKSILVGEKIILTYTLTINSKSKKPSFRPAVGVLPSRLKSKTGSLSNAISDNIEIESPFKDTLVKGKNQSTWTGTYEITAWDEGNYVIAGPTITVDDTTIYFPEAEINVKLVSAKKGQDIYDIKESFAEIPDEPFSLKRFFSSNWWWLLPIMLIPLIFWIVRKIKNAEKAPENVKEMTLKERTLFAIDALEKSKLWEKNQVKEHFSELTFILRSYLSSRYNINLLEKTSHETKLLLLQLGLHAETVRVISEILKEADMVKFAKSHPDEIAIYKHAQLARQVVAETSPIEFDHAE